jgi:hypothetical protein
MDHVKTNQQANGEYAKTKNLRIYIKGQTLKKILPKED